MQSRCFLCPLSIFQDLTRATQDWLFIEGFNCQRFQTEDGGIVLQIETTGGWRKFLGMSTAIHIVFHHVDKTVNVEIGNGQWLDKAAIGLLSTIVLWPLAITAGVGAWRQMKLPERIYGYIADYIDASR